MSQGKKYNVRLVQKGEKWTAEITRRASARKTLVSKRKDHFTSEAEAQAWGDEALKGFLKVQVKRNKDESEAAAKAKLLEDQKQAAYLAAKAERDAAKALEDDSEDFDDLDESEHLDDSED